jgi:hypothetical protein
VSAPVRLWPIGQEQQFRDDAGRLWIANDTRKPGSNPPEEYGEPRLCEVCGGPLGPLTYHRQVTGGPVACAGCVEIVAP